MSTEVRVKEVVTRVYEIEGTMGNTIEFETPKDAVESLLHYWLVKKGRRDSVNNVGKYLLREGTDELVDKVTELREWLSKEEERG